MVLVTGAGGFIGKYVVKKLLDNGRSVIALTRCMDSYKKIGNEIVVEASLEDKPRLKAEFERFDFSTCVHLAWKGIPDYSFEMSADNITNSLNLLEACSQKKIKRLIVSGSCWEYKNPYGSVRVDEELDYSNYFKIAKNMLHSIMYMWCRDNNIQLNWLRLFYVYGPGQRKGTLIPHIIQSFDEGKQPELLRAYNENDFVYVDDVAEAISNCVISDEPYPETMNIGSGKAIKVLDIVKIVAEEYGFDVNTEAYNNSKDSSFYADPEEMFSKFEWRAKTGIREGIRNMISYARREI